MSRSQLLLVVAACCGLGCQTDTGRGGAIPVLGEGDTEAALGYETPPTLRAADLLSAELLASEHHRVRDEVRTDGFLHHYLIESDYGEFAVSGDALLRTRVAEIQALAILDETSQSEEFARALVRGAANPYVAAWNLLKSPIDTLLGVPLQAAEEIRRITSLARSERSEFEDRAIREVLGFEDRKRALAAQLGVDPYTSNATLQRQLNRTAWAAWAGGFAFDLVPFRRDTERALQNPWLPEQGFLGELLANHSPEDLRRMNRIEMAVMGVDTELADAFLGHDHLSPRHHTIISGSLAALDRVANRRAFFEAALTAADEQDALVYQHTAELLGAIHRRVTPIERLEADGPIVRAYLTDGTRVSPVEVDHLIWTRPVEALVERGAALEDAPRREIWLSGSASSKARAEIQARGFGLLEEVTKVFAQDAEGSP